MAITFEALLVSNATGWHDGSETITYTFLENEMPDYYREIDTNGDGQADSWQTYPGLTFPSVPFSRDFSMTAVERAQAERAIAEWNDVANVNIVQGEAGSVGDLALGSSAFTRSNGNPDTGLFGWVADFPRGGELGDPSTHGDVWINSSNPDQDVSELGHTSYNTYLHELGHALGLRHPNEDPGNTAGDPRNNNQWTVMSYAAAPAEANLPLSQQGYGLTPMVLDIQALQALYGANTTTRTGDTVYFGAGDGAQDLAYQYAADNMTLFGRNLLMTIWDAGGTDLIDASGIDTACDINLNPGTYSTIGGNDGNANNIGIAAAVRVDGEVINYIENAWGGAGDDVIRGNATANGLRGNDGDDVLAGNAGADALDGGRGSDALDGGKGSDVLSGNKGGDFFVFSTGYGNDRVTDFTDGVDLIGIGRGAGNFSQITVSDEGRDTVISFSNVEITLKGVDADDITRADFLFF